MVHFKQVQIYHAETWTITKRTNAKFRQMIWNFEANELDSKSSKSNILSSYRALRGNFNQFISNLDDVLKNVYKLTVELSTFRDISTDYLIESNIKKTSLIINNIQSIQHIKYCSKNSK